jgi:predicted HicB family RNase H-like nuclease
VDIVVDAMYAELTQINIELGRARMSTSAGKFMLLRRVPETLHIEMKVAAARQRMTLEAWCRRAFEAAVLAAEQPGEGTGCAPDETGVSVHPSV